MNKQDQQKLSNIEKNQHQTNFYLRALIEHHQIGHLVSLDQWLDDNDLMIRFHLSKRTIQRYRAQGLLPYKKIKRKCYCRQQDIDKLLGNKGLDPDDNSPEFN